MKILLALAFAAALQGAVIRGSVMENQTGHFLARAAVTLDPVAGAPGLHFQSAPIPTASSNSPICPPVAT